MTRAVLEERPPQLTPDGVRRLAEAHWDVTGEVVALSSERDVNFLVGTGHVLKVSNPAESRALVEMEVAAMRHVAATDPGLPVPRVVPSRDGADVVTIVDDEGRACLARLITTVPGTPLEGQVVTEAVAEQVGAATARTARALQGFFHPAAGSRELDWDVRRLPAVAARAGLADDDPLRALVERISASLDRVAVLPSGIRPRRRHPDQPARDRRHDHRGHRLRRHAPHGRRRRPRRRADRGAAQHQRHPGQHAVGARRCDAARLPARAPAVPRRGRRAR